MVSCRFSPPAWTRVAEQVEPTLEVRAMQHCGAAATLLGRGQGTHGQACENSGLRRTASTTESAAVLFFDNTDRRPLSILLRVQARGGSQGGLSADPRSRPRGGYCEISRGGLWINSEQYRSLS